MKGLSPLRRKETFPKKPLRDFPQSQQLELVHMPNKSLARGLVTSTEIYSWTREEITILRAMWLMGSCLNRIEVLVAGGRERGCWAVTVPNRLPYTICIPSSTAPTWANALPIKGWGQSSCFHQPSLSSLCVLVLLLHNLSSFILPPAVSTSKHVLNHTSEPWSAWIYLSSDNIK